MHTHTRALTHSTPGSVPTSQQDADLRSALRDSLKAVVSSLASRVPASPSRGVGLKRRSRLVSAVEALLGVMASDRSQFSTAAQHPSAAVWSAPAMRSAADALWRLGCQPDAVQLLEEVSSRRIGALGGHQGDGEADEPDKAAVVDGSDNHSGGAAPGDMSGDGGGICSSSDGADGGGVSGGVGCGAGSSGCDMSETLVQARIWRSGKRPEQAILTLSPLVAGRTGVAATCR